MPLKNESPTLSILIPSFNQGNEAASTIAHLSEQIDQWPSRIEVLVSDNFSEVDHFDQIKHLVGKYPWLKIYRQEANLGFKGNVGFLARSARFEWCIILGCGDLLDIGTLAQVLHETEVSGIDPNILVTNVVSHNSFDRNPFTGLKALSVASHGPFSKWAPYQEAIPGQLYKTEFLKRHWMSNLQSGETWPHIDLALRLLSRERIVIAKTNAAIVSMHQTVAGWYYRPGANVSTLMKHVFLLAPHMFRSFGIFAKLSMLLTRGLINALSQDKLASAKSRGLETKN